MTREDRQPVNRQGERIMKEAYEKALKELNALIDERIKEVDDSYSKDYKESKWYKKPTIRDAFRDSMASDITGLKEALEKELDVFPFVKEFEITATRYGASWFDEDLQMERCGWEWETIIYARLRNIAATVTGNGSIDWHEYYEGYGA